MAVARLKRLGYFVVESESGADAIAQLSQGLDVDAVFSDVVMPGGQSGFDLARWIASNRPELAVVLTSGFAEDMMAGGDSDHLAILRKPYTQADLAKELAKAIITAKEKYS